MASDTASSGVGSGAWHTVQQGTTNTMVPSTMMEKGEGDCSHALQSVKLIHGYRSWTPTPKSILLSIPTEIQLKIFKLLDATSSTCLGLTNKRCYQIHWEIHGKVPLVAYCMLPPELLSGVHLFTLLEQWVGKELVIGLTCRKLITWEKYKSRYRSYASNVVWKTLAESERAVARIKAKREMGGYYQNGSFRRTPSI